MAELLVWKHPDTAPAIVEREAPSFRWLRLYCWPCNEVHEFVLADVEQIIYALIFQARLGGGDRFDPPPFACLREVLRWPDEGGSIAATLIEGVYYAEHVEQGIIRRTAADGVTPGVLPAEVLPAVLQFPGGRCPECNVLVPGPPHITGCSFGTCPEQFSGLGPEYRCVRAAGHEGWHCDQHDNQWGPRPQA